MQFDDFACRNPDRQPCVRPALHSKLICSEAFAWDWNVNLTKGHTTVGQQHTSLGSFCCSPQPPCQDGIACQKVAEPVLNTLTVQALLVEESLGHG